MAGLRIAQIAPLVERVPPHRYGGTERMVFELTESLVRRGHEVTLFASGNSTTSGRLQSVVGKSLRELNIPKLYDHNEHLAEHLAEAYRRQIEFDVIHDHNDPVFSLPLAQLANTPVTLTLHGPYEPGYRSLYRKLHRPHLVAISHSQARDFALARPDTTVIYHGLRMEHYPFGDQPDDYLLFVGRMSETKGPHRAIEVALTLDLPLVLAAKLDKVDEPYFNKYVKPYLKHPRISWIGEVTESKRNRLMSRARCLLHPVSWQEPFGLVLIEAMACGCPVIGIGRGSIPELIADSVNGYVVEDVPQMIEAVKNIGAISRTVTRRYALSRFSAAAMAERYEQLYRQLTGHPVTVVPPRTIPSRRSVQRVFSFVQTYPLPKPQKYKAP